jgi:hypothetical protein
MVKTTADGCAAPAPASWVIVSPLKMGRKINSSSNGTHE